MASRVQSSWGQIQDLFISFLGLFESLLYALAVVLVIGIIGVFLLRRTVYHVSAVLLGLGFIGGIGFVFPEPTTTAIGFGMMLVAVGFGVLNEFMKLIGLGDSREQERPPLR